MEEEMSKKQDKAGLKRKAKEQKRKAKHPGRYKGQPNIGRVSKSPPEWVKDILKGNEKPEAYHTEKANVQGTKRQQRTQRR